MDDETPVTLQSLRDRYRNRNAPGSQTGNWYDSPTSFLPISVINDFATLEIIWKALELECSLRHIRNGDDKKRFAKTVHKVARKLFVIFLMREIPFYFLQHLVVSKRVTDDSLPLSPEFPVPPSFRTRFILDFLYYQYTLCSPFLEEGFFYERKALPSALPVKQVRSISQSTAGAVYEIRLAHDCFSFPSAEESAKTGRWSRPFAMKAMYEQKHSLRERAFLQSLQREGVKHPNLMTGYTGFEVADTSYIILELADQDLNTFMKRYRTDYPVATTTWLLRQLVGLAEALDKVHNAKPEKQTAYLHDIKPANILVFSGTSGHVLKLAGWSVAKFNRIIADNSHKTDTWGSHRYLPRECEFRTGGRNEPKSSRPDDIWSLAYLYLELLVWFSEGEEGIPVFDKTRVGGKVQGAQISDNFHHDNQVKRIVREKIRDLRPREKMWPCILDTIAAMMTIDPLKRPIARETVKRLKECAYDLDLTVEDVSTNIEAGTETTQDQDEGQAPDQSIGTESRHEVRQEEELIQAVIQENYRQFLEEAAAPKSHNIDNLSGDDFDFYAEEDEDSEPREDIDDDEDAELSNDEAPVTEHGIVQCVDLTGSTALEGEDGTAKDEEVTEKRKEDTGEEAERVN